MTRWARLTWQAARPAALAADLGRRLGVALVPREALDDAFVLPLGTADLEVVPWRREAPGDEPQPAGRLVLEPFEDGAADVKVRPGVPPFTLAGVAWATVELDRAEADLDVWLAPVAEPAMADGPAVEVLGATDPHLGARTRVRAAPGLPGEVLVLSEPATEGRLAASLARDGEGPCALYLAPREGLDAWIRAARARGVTLAGPAAGPFGRSVLLAGGAAAGPHVILVDATAPRPAAPWRVPSIP
jgi:hypothetical protein